MINAESESGSPAPAVPPYLLTGVQVYRRNIIFVRAAIKKFEEDGIPHAFVFRWQENAWHPYVIRHGVTSQCVLDNNGWEVLSLTPEGLVHLATPSGERMETIDPFLSGPSQLRWMYDIKLIDGTIYAVGMARLAYQRTGADSWKSINQGAEVSDPKEIESGFRSIHGVDESLLYAVGFHGEIWCRRRQSWKRLDSPTNVTLHGVYCVSPNEAYACGASGVILKAIGGNWSAIDHEETKSHLWSLQYFEDHMYFADSQSVYRLMGDNLERVDMKFDRPTSTSYLHAQDGVLCSVGANDISLFDNNKWTRIHLPKLPQPER